MKKNIVAISAIMAVVFDLIACLGDSNELIYHLFMGLCCASFCIYVAGLIAAEYSKKDYTEVEAKTAVQSRKAA